MRPPQASDSGADLAAGDSGCISGAESSGRDSSSSSGEPDHRHEQQHTSPAAADQSIEQQQPRGRQAQQQQQAAAAQATGKGKQQQQDAAAGGKVIKIPKLPMVEYAKKWYRAKVLKDTGPKVLLEYQGYSHEGGPFWLAKDHARIWRGSYKGRDWKYLVSWDGGGSSSSRSSSSWSGRGIDSSLACAAGARHACNHLDGVAWMVFGRARLQ